MGQVEDRVSADGASGTGLTYLNARYYDPATSRFISPDPLMDPGDPRTLDPYRYADNNPVVFTDATGLNPFGDAWSYVAGAADSSWDMAWEQQARSPSSMLLTPDRFDKAMAADKAAFNGDVKDYGWAYALDSRLNPVHQLLDAGDAWITAAKAGDWNAAGRAAPAVVTAEASIALVAVPVAKVTAPSLQKLTAWRPTAPPVARPTSAVSGNNLGLKLASESQMKGPGTPMAGAGQPVPIKTALPGLIRDYGGSKATWVKMKSPSYTSPTGVQISTHWYQNIRTGQRVNMKTKITHVTYGKSRT